MYGAAPPVAVTNPVPSFEPLHVTSEKLIVKVGPPMVLITAVAVSEHPLASVIVTEYVPAMTPVIEAVVAELLHEYVYGIVPPSAELLAPPSFKPLQVMFESNTAVDTNTTGSVIITDEESVHPFPSVIVTE